MANKGQPLAEVFGHLTTDLTEKADRYRSHRLCPFNNKVPNCTKDKAKDPLGVCSIYHDNGKVYDFGALEIQAVYISGNVREPFEYFMKDSRNRASMDWSKEPNYPRPDYLSSSRKRLVPQLLFKGEILHGWQKKIAVALNRSFFATLPNLKKVSKSKADIAWLIYDLELIKEKSHSSEKYTLKKVDEVFTEFEPALLSITTPSPGNIEGFVKLLQEKLDDQIETPPITKTIERPF